MRQSKADIIRECGPCPGVEHVHGVTYDGEQLWVATGATLNAIHSESGKGRRSLDVAAHAGSAFDGTYLYQIAETEIRKVDR